MSMAGRVLCPRVVLLLMHSGASSTDALQDNGDVGGRLGGMLLDFAARGGWTHGDIFECAREGARRFVRSCWATNELQYIPHMSSRSLRGISNVVCAGSKACGDVYLAALTALWGECSML